MSYAGEHFKNTGEGKFLTRYAESMKSKATLAKFSEQEEFNFGYKKGSMRFGLASKYMTLATAGLDSYVEDKSGLAVVWKRQGDQIIRIDSDTAWIDELLDQEGNR